MSDRTLRAVLMSSLLTSATIGVVVWATAPRQRLPEPRRLACALLVTPIRAGLREVALTAPEAILACVEVDR